MRAHVDVEKPIAPFRLSEALNARLRPAPVAILACEPVAGDWHARFSCIRRAYEYRIVHRRAPLTWEKGLAWQVPQPLDVAAMQAGADRLVGPHDFTTFRSVHCQSASPLKTLDRLVVARDGELVTVFAQARSFLHHQVRSMVGALGFVGQGKWTPDEVSAALDARDRRALPLNAPPDGLWFLGADYPG
jgi:tRNA pseudouridine38-40 synthase